MLIFAKRCQKTIPVVCPYLVIAYPQPMYPLPQLLRRLYVPFPPDKGYNLSTFPVIRINKLHFVLLFPHIGSKLVYFKTIIVGSLRLYPVFP
jgi:hypothetical protein